MNFDISSFEGLRYRNQPHHCFCLLVTLHFTQKFKSFRMKAFANLTSNHTILIMVPKIRNVTAIAVTYISQHLSAWEIRRQRTHLSLSIKLRLNLRSLILKPVFDFIQCSLQLRSLQLVQSIKRIHHCLPGHIDHRRQIRFDPRRCVNTPDPSII